MGRNDKVTEAAVAVDAKDWPKNHKGRATGPIAEIRAQAWDKISAGPGMWRLDAGALGLTDANAVRAWVYHRRDRLVGLRVETSVVGENALFVRFF